MKKIFFLTLAFALFAILPSNGQVSVNVNFGTPPAWAPANRVQSQYYYLPEIDTYYDVPQQQYIYVEKAKWKRSKYLPKKYKSYNLRRGNIVYLTDYRGNSPYYFHKKHRSRYYRPVSRQTVYVIDRDDDRKYKGKHKKNKDD